MPRITDKPLTQKIIDATPLPATGLTCSAIPISAGLGVRIWASGAKTWTFEFGLRCQAKTPDRPARGHARRGARAGEGFAGRRRRRIRDPSTAQAAQKGVMTVAGGLDMYEAAVVLKAARATSRRARMALLRKTLEPFNKLPVA